MTAGRTGLRRLLQLAPATIVFIAVFCLPISYFFVVSFWRVRSFRLRPDATLDQYRAVFEQYSGPLFNTILVAFLIGATTTLLAFAFAYFCRFKAGRWGNLLIFLALVTLFGGYLTKIYMWRTILGSGGILNSALMQFGFISEPIEALLYNTRAVVIALVHYTLPLSILPIYGALRAIDDVPLEAARDLGASRMRSFLDIVLPQARLGIISAFSLSFIFAAGDYVTPLLVGGPNTSMFGLFIQNQFGARLNSPLGSAMSFVMIASCLVVIGIVAAAIRAATRSRQ